MQRRKAKPGQAPSEDARRRILSAARHAFASVGFEGAATRSIAAEAGVAQSLLLYHFGSKDALWRAVMDDMFAQAGARLAAGWDPAAGTPVAERLMAFARAFIGMCAADADMHRIMTIEGRQQSDRLRWLVDRHLRDVHATCAALIRQGQAEGTVRAGDPTLLYYSVIAIAGTTFSLAPEIALVSGKADAVDPQTVEALIRAMLLVA